MVPTPSSVGLTRDWAAFAFYVRSPHVANFISTLPDSWRFPPPILDHVDYIQRSPLKELGMRQDHVQCTIKQNKYATYNLYITLILSKFPSQKSTYSRNQIIGF